MFNLSPVEIACLLVLVALAIAVVYHLHTVKAVVATAVTATTAAADAVKAHVAALEPAGNTTARPLPMSNTVFPLPLRDTNDGLVAKVPASPSPEHVAAAALLPVKPVETEQDATSERARVEAVASILKAQADNRATQAVAELAQEHARIDAQALIDKADATQKATSVQSVATVDKARAEAARTTALAHIDADLAGAKRQAGH